MFGTQSPRKNADSTTDSGPRRQFLTCRVKSEDLQGKRTALIQSVVFNFLTLPVMHGHNRGAEIAFPGCWVLVQRNGAIMRCHTAEGTNGRCAAETQTDVTDVLAASSHFAKALLILVTEDS